jgi:hypothetical protein
MYTARIVMDWPMPALAKSISSYFCTSADMLDDIPDGRTFDTSIPEG